MAFVWDPIYAVNLTLCIIIVILGYWGYKKTQNKTALYIGAAFLLYGISHLATLLGYKAILTDVLIIVRTIGYLIVVFALYRIAVKK